MGSLMAGWDSPVKDPKTVKFQRNKSLTRGEIDAYWRSKKPENGEGSCSSSGLSSPVNKNQDKIYKRLGEKLQRSNSLPVRRDGAGNSSVSFGVAEKVASRSCWWTGCSSAFLNDTPVMDVDGAYRRPYQYHVSKFGTAN